MDECQKHYKKWENKIKEYTGYNIHIKLKESEVNYTLLMIYTSAAKL